MHNLITDSNDPNGENKVPANLRAGTMIDASAKDSFHVEMWKTQKLNDGTEVAIPSTKKVQIFSKQEWSKMNLVAKRQGRPILQGWSTQIVHNPTVKKTTRKPKSA